MRTVFTPPVRVWTLIGAVSVSLLSLTACDRTTEGMPAPTGSMERPNDANRAPATPATPADPPAQAIPPVQPDSPPAPGTGGTAQ
ncbi:hypothetical protein ACVC7V_10820 [Hydrogenophaga sp. A37]|uniref:hypothetical protein n=1 Tax=Hydrogenophaga sp. A37 TaxID=1945864 RepID=UPI00117A2B82|nr:hypothetical protein [Hydrogenophaga sp. A37]